MLKPHNYVQTRGKQGEMSELKSTERTKDKENESVSPGGPSAGTSGLQERVSIPSGAGGAA